MSSSSSWFSWSKYAKRSAYRAAAGRAVEALEGRLYRDSSPWAWNAVMIHQDQAVADFPWLTGAGQTVVVLDTGVDMTHPSFSGKTLTYWQDFLSTKSPSATPIDTIGHGTGVNGIIAGNHFDLNGFQDQGIAPGINLIVLRTDTEKASTPWGTQAQRISNALDWVIANQAGYNIVAVNMSTGSNAVFTDPSTPNDPNNAIDQVLRQKFATLAGEGVFLCAAAGNDGSNALDSTLNPPQPNSVEYPAADPNVFAISSVGSSGAVSSWASRGVLTDLLAPGENVYMPYGDISGQPYINYGNGTSFSAPMVTAAAALIKQINPGFTPAQIMQILQDSGSPVYDPTTGNSFRLMNLDAALRLAYAELDDLNNHSLATATPIDMSGGTGQLTGLTLEPGQSDYYSFVLGTRSDVSVSVALSGATGVTQLLAANGSVFSGGLTQTLSAGTYYVRVTANGSSAGTYDLTVTATASVSPTPTPTPFTNATAAKIAYDAAGDLYLAYYDGASRTLKFAQRNAGGSWSAATTIDSTPGAGTQLSIAVDPSGHPGIAYFDSANADLKYAHFNGSSWDVSTPDYYRTTGLTPSLAYMSNGQPLIAYYDSYYGQLRLANQIGSAWAVFTVDSGGVGLNASIAYDAAVNAYGIGYENVKSGALKYATYYRRAFRTSTIDATTTSGVSDLSMKIDPLTHNPAVSYFDVKNADLVYAAYTGRWSTTHVATLRSQGQYSSLSFDGSGNPDILYYSATYNAINEAKPSGSLWSLTRVLDGGGASLAEASNASGKDTIAWIDAGDVEFMDF